MFPHLQILTYHLLSGLPGTSSIDKVRLARYLRRMEEGYPVGNPYHCRTHGADVVRAMYCLLTQGGVLQTVWPDEGAADMALLTGVFSAAIHDYEHKGVTVGGMFKSSSNTALSPCLLFPRSLSERLLGQVL